MSNQKKTSDIKKKNIRKTRGKKGTKSNQVLSIMGMVMAAIQFVVSAIFMVFLHCLGLIPMGYQLLIGFILVLSVLITLVSQRWKLVGIVTKMLSLIMVVVLIMGCVYLGYTRGALGKLTGGNTKRDVISVYVLADDKAETLDDINGYTCGKIPSMDMENTNKMMDYIEKYDKVSLTYLDYSTIMDLMNGLLDGSVKSIIINESYLETFDDVEGFENIEDRIKRVFSQEYITDIAEDNNLNYMSNDNVVSIYISGIDTYGTPNTTSRSDVNILMFINTKTHQILMINTPRDYYVPLSISGGVKDKLTHAGVYGIECSKSTLEMLYGVNIDYYFRVNFTGFMNIIDKLGGIDVSLDYDATLTQTGYLTVHKGINHFNSEQALVFARERYAYVDGDNQRGKNQMMVIEAVLDKLMSPSLITHYTDILSSISGSMITSMPYDKISELAQMQISKMPTWDIQTYSVSGEGDLRSTFSMGSTKLYVMIPNESQMEQAKWYLKQMYNDNVIKISDNN